MKRAAQLLVLLSSMLLLGGCEALLLGGVGAGLGIGGYKFMEGKLEKQYPVDYQRAWDATNTALTNLQISVSGSLNEGVKGEIEAIRKDGVKIYISLKDMGQKVTSIGVRVGTFGNRSDADRLHTEIATAAGI